MSASAEPGPLLFAVVAGAYLALAQYVTYCDRELRWVNAGHVVVAFTDGLVEHRSWSLNDAFAHLARLARDAPSRDPEALCDLLLAEGSPAATAATTPASSPFAGPAEGGAAVVGAP